MQSNEIETKAKELYEQNNPNWKMERFGEWRYLSKSRKDYYQQIALDKMNKELTITADIVEMQEEGKAKVRKAKANVVNPRTPEERLALMGMAINRKKKSIKDARDQLNAMKKEYKAMAKVVNMYHKIISEQ